MTDRERGDHNPAWRESPIAEHSPLSGVRICYFGRYDPHNLRNRLLARCLEHAGAEVISIRDDRGLVTRTPALARRTLQSRFDLIIVGFRAHSDMLLASLLARMRGLPLVFDPLTSRYEERVIDRQQVSPSSPLARWYRATDAAGCRLADCVLFETDAQASFFQDTFGVPASKCRRVWLGADDEVMYPRPATLSGEAFNVFFYGRFSPLHGIEHIVEAASILEQRGESVRFTIVGGGQTYRPIRALVERLGVTSITFHEPMPYPALAARLSAADLSLGTFGLNARARRVIPYKVFDALAAGRPVLTADTPAIREVLTPGHDVWTCPSGDSAALADAVVTLKRQPDLRERLAANGLAAFRTHFSPAALERDLVAVVRELVPASLSDVASRPS